jgi:hypothetical protein
MNRSYSKIRHIQEANLLLEKRLLESKSGNFKPLISEQEVKQGAAGDHACIVQEGQGNLTAEERGRGCSNHWIGL